MFNGSSRQPRSFFPTAPRAGRPAAASPAWPDPRTFVSRAVSRGPASRGRWLRCPAACCGRRRYLAQASCRACPESAGTWSTESAIWRSGVVISAGTPAVWAPATRPPPFLVLDTSQAVLDERAGLLLHFTAGRRGNLGRAVTDGLVRGVLDLAATRQGNHEGGSGQGGEAEFHASTLTSAPERKLAAGRHSGSGTRSRAEP